MNNGDEATLVAIYLIGGEEGRIAFEVAHENFKGSFIAVNLLEKCEVMLLTQLQSSRSFGLVYFRVICKKTPRVPTGLLRSQEQYMVRIKGLTKLREAKIRGTRFPGQN